MQLIKDFADIPRFVNFLNADYQQKLLNEINSLIVRFMDEQTKENSSTTTNPNQDAPVEQNKQPKNLSFQPIQNAKPQLNAEANAGLNALKSNFGIKGNMPPPPPLPTQQTIAAVPMQLSRGVGAGQITLKGSLTSNKPQNKKAPINLLDSLGYIVPLLTDMGENELKNPNTKTDVYQLLKQVDGQASLKQIYMFLNPNSSLWGKFLNQIYPLYRERSINLNKLRTFPTDVEISLKIGELMVASGLINDTDLEKALEHQKNPPANNTQQNQGSQTPSWMEKAKSIVGQADSSSNNNKKKLGEVMIELKMVTKDELDNALTIQKWIKNIIEHS